MKKATKSRVRKDRADKLLDHVANYLFDGGWILDSNTLLWIDPVTLVKNHTTTALNVQIDRDLN